MICEHLRDKLYTICSAMGLDNALNIVYNKHTRRSRVQIRAVMLFLTHTGSLEVSGDAPLSYKIRNAKKGFDYEANKTKRLRGHL